MAGKIAKQVKNDRPTLVNGRWVHKYFDSRPLTKAEIERTMELAKRFGWKSR